MPAAVLIGAQWGDEGKGKATDLLGSRLDYVVKFNGGNNAGHTVVVGEEKYALHLLPSGILTPGVTPVIGNGVVVDVEVLFEELEGLESRGVDVSRLRISANAHLITQYHRTLDKVTERFLGKRQIGTTGRGIGPAYADKINRVGLRMQDLFDENILRQKVEGALDQKNHLLVKVYNRRAIGVDEVVDELLGYVDRLRPMVTDTSLLLHQALERGETVLFEGGQATMLDVDHGTYPFVTSSNATSGGAVTGSGIAPNRIDRVIAVVKAYTTRVGAGPFPTELFDEWGDFLTERGFEFGTTTGRRRRTGWYDAPIARYASRINGVTDFVLTKLDVLTGLERIPVARRVRGRRPAVRRGPRLAVGLPPRGAGLRGVPRLERGHLGRPRVLRAARERPEPTCASSRAMSGSRISAIGVGPGRDEIVQLHDLPATEGRRRAVRRGGAITELGDTTSSTHAFRFGQLHAVLAGDRAADHGCEQGHDPARADERLEPDDGRAAGCRGTHRVRVVGRHAADHAAERERPSRLDRGDRRRALLPACDEPQLRARGERPVGAASTRRRASSGPPGPSRSGATTPRRVRRRWPARR